MSVDIFGAGGVRVLKISGVFAGDANVPGVLMPYENSWLDLAGGTAQVIIEKNGVPLISGTAAGGDVEIYPGTEPSNGDIKTVSGLADGDVLTVHYISARFDTITAPT